jgi:hypothetical protein
MRTKKVTGQGMGTIKIRHAQGRGKVAQQEQNIKPGRNEILSDYDRLRSNGEGE